MNDATALREEPSLPVMERWYRLKEEQPGLRIRDAAALLGVSEVELVAARCGDGVERLRGPWGDLVAELPSLGTVMALTRNDHVVHEKTGAYGNISIFTSMGLVLNGEIDLRLLFNSWATGYAVTETTASGVRHSLQFFDAHGTAVHKIHLVDQSDEGAYRALVGKFRHPNQAPGETVVEASSPQPERPDDRIDREELRKRWLALRDVHDFMGLLKELDVGRVQALRLVGEDLACRISTGSFRTALQLASAASLPIMVFVGSPGVIQIHSGIVRALKETGPWFNVLDPGFNLHLRTDRIASAWVVRKPTRDGFVSSLEIFDADDRQIALMFGVRHEGEQENQAWRDLVESIGRKGL